MSPIKNKIVEQTVERFDPVSKYPSMLRIGHTYQNSLGQRFAQGGFKGPQDVSVGNDGWLYVVNRFPGGGMGTPRSRFVRVRVDDNGYEDDIITSLSGNQDPVGYETLPSPVMCTIDDQGILYLTDEHVNLVAKFDSKTGEAVGSWGKKGTGPGFLNAPAGIVIDNDGNVWVVNTLNHRVDRFTIDGEYISSFGEFGTEEGQLNHPWGIAIDPITETILVADWRNNRVQRFSANGVLLQIIGGPGSGTTALNHPSGVAVDNEGDIYIADRSNDRVLLFNPRGNFIESFRGDATLNERGIQKLMTNLDMLRLRENVINLDDEKRFKNPTSVKIGPDGLVLMVDSGRYRIQIYKKNSRVLLDDQIDPPSMHLDPVLT